MQRTQLLGTSDNSVGPIAGSSPTDVWAVGDYLPDQADSNQDATLTFAEHWNGKQWTVVRTPNTGPNFNSFYGLAASGGEAWAVGQQLGAQAPDQGLVEHWNGHRWSMVSLPASVSASVLLDGLTVSHGQVWVVGESDSPAGGGRPLAEHYVGGKWYVEKLPAVPHGANWSNLYGVAAAQGSVWAVGTYVDPATDNNDTLVLRDTAGTWSVSDAPNAGGSGFSDIPGGISAVDGQLWLAGTYTTAASGEIPLIEHR